MLERLELLAPAEDLEKIKEVSLLLYGADACFCAGKKIWFTCECCNLLWKKWKEGVKLAHSLRKKNYYITVDIFVS